MALIGLGVTGGIGAYKAVEIVRGLQQKGHDVVAVMTENACRFVGPLTFEAITGKQVVTDQFTSGANTEIAHIALATELDVLLVAPATANILGKFANGIADDVLSSLYLATSAPVIVAPAMNTQMLTHDAVRENIDRLENRGVRFVNPGEGYLACGWVGKGRLAEPDDVVSAAVQLLNRGESLLGRCVLVTAGPTLEDFDPVRFLGNRSTGRMGYAIAEEALSRGARVVLVSGPTSLEPLHGAEIIQVRSAEEMNDAVTSRVCRDKSSVDIVVMAAAVSDYTLAGGPQTSKINRDREELVLKLHPTVDILAKLGLWRAGRNGPVLVGFAAETDDLLGRARDKLRRKAVDFVVANDVSLRGAGFAVDTNIATLVSRNEVEEVPLTSKRTLARIIFDRVERCLGPLSAVKNAGTST